MKKDQKSRHALNRKSLKTPPKPPQLSHFPKGSLEPTPLTKVPPMNTLKNPPDLGPGLVTSARHILLKPGPHANPSQVSKH